MMEMYPWWSEKRKKLAEEAEKFTDEDYGGLDVGVTGCCIMAEELGRICPALTAAYSVTMFSDAFWAYHKGEWMKASQ